MLLQRDAEGGTSDLWKIYYRVQGDGVKWFTLR